MQKRATKPATTCTRDRNPATSVHPDWVQALRQRLPCRRPGEVGAHSRRRAHGGEITIRQVGHWRGPLDLRLPLVGQQLQPPGSAHPGKRRAQRAGHIGLNRGEELPLRGANSIEVPEQTLGQSGHLGKPGPPALLFGPGAVQRQEPRPIRRRILQELLRGRWMAQHRRARPQQLVPRSRPSPSSTRTKPRSINSDSCSGRSRVLLSAGLATARRTLSAPVARAGPPASRSSAFISIRRPQHQCLSEISNASRKSPMPVGGPYARPGAPCPEGTSENSPAFQRWASWPDDPKSPRDGRGPLQEPHAPHCFLSSCSACSLRRNRRNHSSPYHSHPLNRLATGKEKPGRRCSPASDPPGPRSWRSVSEWHTSTNCSSGCTSQAI